MFRDPQTHGKSPRLSKSRAQALKRKDRFPKLPLGITLRETRVVMQLKWHDLMTLAWLVLFAYVGVTLGFSVLKALFADNADTGFALYLARTEALGLMRAFVVEFLLIGFYALAVYRLMLLGEPLSAPKFSDSWVRRYLAFLVTTARAMAWPALAFLPYALFIILQIIWAANGGAPDWVPQHLLAAQWPTDVLKLVCALGFYIAFARLVFVQPATAVDVPYSPRESWRVTNWIWGSMLILTVCTLGLAMAAIALLQLVWPIPAGPLGILMLGLGLLIACAIWILGMTGFVVSLSIAFCLRTGWRPGAEKLSLKPRTALRKPRR